MRKLAFIPARSGSKGLPDKNILPLRGKPLMAYTIEAAVRSGEFDVVHVSTDSERYAAVARSFGADVPFLRSVENSGDSSSTWSAVTEVLGKYEAAGQAFDCVAVLQPTSPLRTVEDITAAFRTYDRPGVEAIVSVCEVDHSPRWCNTLPKDGCMKGFISGKNAAPRQMLDQQYRLNGAIYIASSEAVRKGGIPYDSTTFAYMMPRGRSVDIDDEFDFHFAEYLMEREAGQWPQP